MLAAMDAPRRTMIAEPVVFAVSTAAMLALWVAAAWIAADPMTLPSPGAVAVTLAGEAETGALWRHMAATVLRVAWAFALAMGIGAGLGILFGLMPRLNRWADPWIVVALNLPALVVIVLCYLWIGLNEVAAVVAVSFNKMATVLVTVREGTKALDPRVAEMARVFGMRRAAVLRHVILPQLAPYLAASARNGLAIIWKLVLVVEFLGRSSGVGFQIHYYFQLFDVAHVLAYALSFVALMLALEYAAVQPLERRAARWRAA